MNKLDVDMTAIGVAGLLHDIGKIRQRTGLNIEKESYNDACPIHFKKGYKTHRHAAHTAYFFNEILAKKGYDFDKSYRWACNHHHKMGSDTPIEEVIVQIADRIASGHDRDKFKEYEGEVANYVVKQQEDYISALLYHPFQNIAFDNVKIIQKKVLPLQKQHPDIAPVDIKKRTKAEAQKEYLNLWQGFEKDFLDLPDYDHSNNWLNKVMSLLEQYSNSVPASSYGNLPTTSLFDHSRLVAAFSCALFGFYKDGNNKIDEKFIRENKTFTLIKGEFSGIQNFIFDFKGESQKNAAKILRAKSFHVSAVTEFSAMRICEVFGIPQTNIVLNAGGSFIVLAPCSNDRDKKINQVKTDIANYFDDLTFGQTRFIMDYEDASGNDFGRDGAFKKLLGKLSLKLDRQKFMPQIDNPVYQDYLKSFYMVDNEVKACEICGYRPQQKNGACRECVTFKKLGENLVKTTNPHLIFNNSPTNLVNIVGNWGYSITNKEGLSELGENIIFDLNNVSGNFASKRFSTYVPTFTTTNDPRYDKLEGSNSFDDPVEGDIKTLHHIGCEALTITKECKIKGKDFIAVLKADVDNLGQVFWLPNGDDVDLSRTTTISRAMDYFFNGWLQDTIKKSYPDTYTVFAGGDDLFIIGPWNKIIKLAQEINNHFKVYTGANPYMSLSAGITVSRPSRPIRQLGEVSEGVLEQSKNRKLGDKIVKSAITIFGETVSWRDYQYLLEQSDVIKQLLDSGVAVGQIYNLLHFIDMKIATDKGKNIMKNAKWCSALNYMIERNVKKEKQEIFRQLGADIEIYGGAFKIAVNCALYEYR